MIIIAYEKNRLHGGFGDRVVGLISCKMMAYLLKRDFKIIWNKEQVDKYIDYNKYKSNIDNIKNATIYNLIDKQLLIKDYLINSNNIFPEDTSIFYINQEISQYIYLNNYYNPNKINNYKDIILNMYIELYTDILKPTEYSLNKINNIINNTEDNIIGIQIRTGDYYMKTNKGETYRVFNNPDDELIGILYKIKEHIDNTYNKYKVFITSDYPNILNISNKIFNNIIYNDEDIQHIDRINNGDFSKFFIDNYILSQKTKRLYISEWSNYGRIAALSSPINEIFGLDTTPIDKYALISKHEILIK